MSDRLVSLKSVINIAMQYCPDDDGSCSKADVDMREMLDELENLSPAEQPKAKNIGTDYGEQDQFICSECGIHLQDWVRIDEDDYEDGIVHEYVFRFCPNCGRRIDDER